MFALVGSPQLLVGSVSVSCVKTPRPEGKPQHPGQSATIIPYFVGSGGMWGSLIALPQLCYGICHLDPKGIHKISHKYRFPPLLALFILYMKN